jgi:acetylornithine aminotransferase (EC 2.6.1.11)
MGYIVEMGELYLAPNYKRIPLAFVRGQGARLFTEEGVEYLDFTSGLPSATLGILILALFQLSKNK